MDATATFISTMRKFIGLPYEIRNISTDIQFFTEKAYNFLNFSRTIVKNRLYYNHHF